MRKAANLIPASTMTIQNVAKKTLNLKPFKEPRSFRLYHSNYTKRLKFANFVKSKRINLETCFICSDQAHFYLHGGQNLQNNRIWSEYGPTEQTLNDEKVMATSID